MDITSSEYSTIWSNHLTTILGIRSQPGMSGPYFNCKWMQEKSHLTFYIYKEVK
jgi:hypothetical protein